MPFEELVVQEGRSLKPTWPVLEFSELPCVCGLAEVELAPAPVGPRQFNVAPWRLFLRSGKASSARRVRQDARLFDNVRIPPKLGHRSTTERR